jgi:hypothetical protein
MLGFLSTTSPMRLIQVDRIEYPHFVPFLMPRATLLELARKSSEGILRIARSTFRDPTWLIRS